MKIKILNCLYCEQEMEIVTLKKRFCSDKCRVYYNRENRHYNGGFVYCLRNPLENNKIFYIGKTINSLNKRLKEHVSNCNKNNKNEKDNIIKLILDAKMDVIIEEIEFIEDISILDEREKYWIKSFSDNKLSNINNYKKCKSNPIGVRFDLYKLEMIQKEQNLTSVQQVVNYLMDNYQSISTSKTLLEIRDLKDEPNILEIGSIKLDKKEMPKGLSIEERIKWLEENEKL